MIDDYERVQIPLTGVLALRSANRDSEILYMSLTLLVEVRRPCNPLVRSFVRSFLPMPAVPPCAIHPVVEPEFTRSVCWCEHGNAGPSDRSSDSPCFHSWYFSTAPRKASAVKIAPIAQGLLFYLGVYRPHPTLLTFRTKSIFRALCD